MTIRPHGKHADASALSHQAQLECQLIVTRSVVIALANNLNPEQKQMVDRAAIFLVDNFPWMTREAADYARKEVRDYLGMPHATKLTSADTQAQ